MGDEAITHRRRMLDVGVGDERLRRGTSRYGVFDFPDAHQFGVYLHFRVLYVWFVYSQFTVKSIEQLYILYPTTWVLSGLAQMITYYIWGKKHGHFKKKEKVE